MKTSKLLQRLSLIFIVSVFLLSCTRESVDPQPTATIISAEKIYAGSNPSIKITYRLSSTANVSRTMIGNVGYGQPQEVPTADGEAIVYDHGYFHNTANYYFIFNMNSGSQIQSNVVTFYF